MDNLRERKSAGARCTRQRHEGEMQGAQSTSVIRHSHMSRATPQAFLVTTYSNDTPSGSNLGTPGYSYEFVTRLFVPLLQRWGEVIEIARPERDLDNIAVQTRERGLEPVHICFRAFQDVCLTAQAPNVVVPAWEYPDIPDHIFDGNPRNDWIGMANRSALVIVGGPFTRDALIGAGVRTPVCIVPVPTANEYFSMAEWQPGQASILGCRALVFPERIAPSMLSQRLPPPPSESGALVGHWTSALKRQLRQAYKRFLRPRLPRRLEAALTAGVLAAGKVWREVLPPPAAVTGIPLSGVVYASIFNPTDGRKNWEDLLTGFLRALGDKDDATLVIKLITNDATKARYVYDYYRGLGIEHRCRLVFIADYLSDEQMRDIARASAFYLQTTRAEGNCLPLMNYLAAGRPAISPRHTAIADYFTTEHGFVIESHPEPTSWPHDSRHRCRTTWQRLVWPSLVEQIKRSYFLVKENVNEYWRLAKQVQGKMSQWAGESNVAQRLEIALRWVQGDQGAKSRAA